MAEVIWITFSARGVIVAFSAAALWMAAAPRSRAPRRFLIALAIFYWVASSWGVTHTASELIARGYRPFTPADVPPGRTAVVLLGGASLQVRDWSENILTMLDQHSATRTLEAARVFKLIDPPLLVSSGGVVRPERLRPSGLSMSDELVRLGVPRDRILVEVDSGTTRDEAVIVKDMLASRGIDHIVLVTSAVHMRRSVGAFRAVGFRVVPAIARDPLSVDTWWENFVPTNKGFEEGALVAHEALGLVWYWARGWLG